MLAFCFCEKQVSVFYSSLKLGAVLQAGCYFPLISGANQKLYKQVVLISANIITTNWGLDEECLPWGGKREDQSSDFSIHIMILLSYKLFLLQHQGIWYSFLASFVYSPYAQRHVGISHTDKYTQNIYKDTKI